MTAAERIEINPKVMLGKPVIRGTRRPRGPTSDRDLLTLRFHSFGFEDE